MTTIQKKLSPTKRLAAAIAFTGVAVMGASIVATAGSTAAPAQPAPVAASPAPAGEPTDNVVTGDEALGFRAVSISRVDLIVVQRNLSGLGYYPRKEIDGSYGPKTTAAVRAFQQHRCLEVDGQAGPITQAALRARVKLVQQKVGAAADGDYGPKTYAAVKKWQASKGLEADGIAGPRTHQALGMTRVRDCETNDPKPPTPPTSGRGEKIREIATREYRNTSRNHEIGGTNCNYYTGYLNWSWVPKCGSQGWRAEEWCADFGIYVWRQVGGISTKGLHAGARSFREYGQRHGTFRRNNPKIGDAVVFNWNGHTSPSATIHHVGLVTQVTSSHVYVTSGNSRGSDGRTAWITVRKYPLGSSLINGYTTPVSG